MMDLTAATAANLLPGAGVAVAIALIGKARHLGRRATVNARRLVPDGPTLAGERSGRSLRAAVDAPFEHRVALAIPLALVLGVVGGSVLPAVIVATSLVALPSVASRIGHRRLAMRIDAEMPPFLDEMARGMRAGLSPGVAFCEAASTGGPALVGSSAGIVGRLRSGDDLVRACCSWADERALPSTELLATAVSVGAEVGSIHPRTIDAVATTLRERQGVAAELATQALQARLSALVMTVAPILFCSFLVLSDARASQFLLRTPAGIGCALVGLGLDAVAALWMASLARNGLP